MEMLSGCCDIIHTYTSILVIIFPCILYLRHKSRYFFRISRSIRKDSRTISTGEWILIRVVPYQSGWQLSRLSAAIVVKSAYGHEILSNDDEYVKLAAVATSTALSLGAPGLNIVDLLPFCERCLLLQSSILIFSRYSALCSLVVPRRNYHETRTRIAKVSGEND